MNSFSLFAVFQHFIPAGHVNFLHFVQFVYLINQIKTLIILFFKCHWFKLTMAHCYPVRLINQKLQNKQYLTRFSTPVNFGHCNIWRDKRIMILPFLFKLISADCTNNQCDIKEKLIGKLMKSQKGEFSEKIEIRQGQYG